MSACGGAGRVDEWQDLLDAGGIYTSSVNVQLWLSFICKSDQYFKKCFTQASFKSNKAGRVNTIFIRCG